MFNSMRISVLIVFVVTNVQNRTLVRAMPPVLLTPPQLELISGIYTQKHWCESWFTLVNDGQQWMDVYRLVNPNFGIDAWKKLHLIPQMMGCMYGVKFYWFLSLAITVIGECKELSQQQNANSDDCWNQLKEVLQKGSCTISVVISSLLYTCSITGQDINLDIFYQIISMIRNFLNEHSVVEYAVVLPDGLDYVQPMKNHFVTLHSFLTSYCQPAAYPQLNIIELTVEFERRFPGAKRYVYYVYIIKYYLEEVSAHLFEMGFRYNADTGQTTFINPL